MVSAVPADATEVHMPKHKSSSTNGLPLQGGKVHPNFENQKKFFGKKFFKLRPGKYAESIGEIRFKSVDN